MPRSSVAAVAVHRKRGFVIQLEGVVQNGVIVPDDSQALPEGTRVRIEPVTVGKRKVR